MDLQEIAKKHGVVEVELPGWEMGESFPVKMKRPTLYNMASTGMVPNPLLNVAQDMFMASPKAVERVPLDKQSQMMIHMARYALVEPSYDEIIAAGLTLTDEQLLAIYAFSIGGAAALAPFREALRGRPHGNGASVRGKTKQPTSDK